MVVTILKNILLTFDVEEFDLPLEYNCNIDREEAYEISFRGMKNLLKILENYGISATFFTVASFANRYKSLMRGIAKKHEIASHGYEHGDDYIILDEKNTYQRIKKSREVLENVCKTKVFGFRAPTFRFNKYSILGKAGYVYDSSLHPTYIPGRYNNLLCSRYVFN